MIIVAKLSAKMLQVVHLADSKHEFVCAEKIDEELIRRLRAASGARIVITECKTELFEKDLDEMETMSLADDEVKETKPGVVVLGSAATSWQISDKS